MTNCGAAGDHEYGHDGPGGAEPRVGYITVTTSYTISRCISLLATVTCQLPTGHTFHFVACGGRRGGLVVAGVSLVHQVQVTRVSWQVGTGHVGHVSNSRHCVYVDVATAGNVDVDHVALQQVPVT